MTEIGLNGAAPVMAFSNQKGGVGKSTISLQAAFFAGKAKLRTLVIDFDSQGNSSKRIADGREYNGTSTADLFSARTKKISPMVCPRGVDLIWANNEDARMANLESARMSQIINPAKHIHQLRYDYDVIILDCPPALGRKLSAALLAATHVIVPVEVAGFAFDGMSDLMDTLSSLKDGLNPDLEIAGVIVNKLDQKRKHTVQVADQLSEELGELVLENRLKIRGAYDDANYSGVPVWTLKGGAAQQASKEMKAVVKEVFGRCGAHLS